MKQGTWDFLIAGGVIVTLVVAIWARISRQTVPELFGGIKDLIVGGEVS